ncbi:MAG: hypothetical protein WAZ50_03030 [Minisyncoccia bacterium]
MSNTAEHIRLLKQIVSSQEALELVTDTVADYHEKCERLHLENIKLQQRNNALAWLAFNHINIITGRLKEHQA